MTSKVGKRPLRSLSAHEKMDAIRRVHDGESKASVARDIGVPESTLRGWCKNEDKILYLSRQSTPETDDSSEPREKKSRYNSTGSDANKVAKESVSSISPQPYNLSVKAVDEPAAAAYSPPAPVVEHRLDSTAVAMAAAAASAVEPSALNLSKQDAASPKASAGMSERERNRAELTRLSIELGLNRPEMFMPNSNIAANLTDLSASLTANLGLMAQWNSALMQQVNTKKQQRSPSESTSVSSSTPAPLSQKSPKIKNKDQPTQHPTQQLPPALPSAEASVEDNVWYWLKTQQAMLGLVQQSSNSNQNTVDPNSSWFWKWYKQFAYSQQQQQQAGGDKPILYQQLTKDANSENLLKTEEQPKPTKVNTNTKARAVLDNLLLNNNNNNNVSVKRDVVAGGKEETPASPSEALEHGEKFLRWLEGCGDPSVTAMQILQFRYLLNNVRTCADRKNNAPEHQKTKVRSRK